MSKSSKQIEEDAIDYLKLVLKNLNILTEKFLKGIENLSGMVVSIFIISKTYFF